MLENRVKHIELVSVRQPSDTSPALATVFVPDSAADHFLKKVEAYRSEHTKNGKPKNQALVSRIENIALAALRSLFTDDPALLPPAGQRIWWEVWIRQGHAETFDTVATRLAIPVQQQRLLFPDREVRLVFGNEVTIARLFVNSDAIAELRRAKDTPALFVRWSNVEQAAWATDLVARLAGPESHDVSVCAYGSVFPDCVYSSCQRKRGHLHSSAGPNRNSDPDCHVGWDLRCWRSFTGPPQSPVPCLRGWVAPLALAV